MRDREVQQLDGACRGFPNLAPADGDDALRLVPQPFLLIIKRVKIEDDLGEEDGIVADPAENLDLLVLKDDLRSFPIRGITID